MKFLCRLVSACHEMLEMLGFKVLDWLRLRDFTQSGRNFNHSHIYFVR